MKVTSLINVRLRKSLTTEGPHQLAMTHTYLKPLFSMRVPLARLKPCPPASKGVKCQTSASLSWERAAEKALSVFNPSLQAIPPRTHHGAAELMQPRPRGLIAAQSQSTLQPQWRLPLVFGSLRNTTPETKATGVYGYPEGVSRQREKFRGHITLRAAKQHTFHLPGSAVSAAWAAKPVSQCRRNT